MDDNTHGANGDEINEDKTSGTNDSSGSIQNSISKSEEAVLCAICLQYQGTSAFSFILFPHLFD